jgi:hypothetical protein
MTGPGGTNTLVSGNNTNVSEGRLGFLSGSTNAPAGPGFTFASGFAPNYCIILNGGGTPYQLFADYFQLWPGGTNSSGFATNAYYLGYSEATIDTIITNGTLGGFNPFGIQATINNSNTGGVDGGTSEGVGCTNYYGGGPESAQAALVGTGIELGIPLAAIGNPTGQIAVCAFIANPGEYVSNQFLPPIDPTIANNGTTCWANLTAATNSRAINLNGVPISPYFVVGPEPHITSISITNTNSVAISYLTANNANMFYQLQRATSLTNGATWSQLYPNKPGTNGFAPFTYTDTKAATNKSGMFYRVQQSPACTTP